MSQSPEERVEPVQPVNYPPVPASTSSGGGIKQIVVMGLLALIVAFGMAQFYVLPNVVSKADFTKNIGNIVTDIGGLKSSVTALSGISAQLNDVNKSVSGIQSDINTLRSSQMTEAKVNSIVSGSLGSVNNSITALQNSVGKMATTSDLSSVSTSLSDLKKSLTTVQSDIKALQTKVDTMQQAPPVTSMSITSFTPTSGAAGAIVTISGANFSGITNVTFGGTSATSFTMNSATQITAVVASGSTGPIVVYSATGSASSTSQFTYTGTGGTNQPPTTGVSTSFSPTTAFTLPNMVSISITNNSGKDIFGGQFSMTVQYLGTTPSASDPVGMASTDIVWRTGGSVAGLNLTRIGDAGSVFVLSGQTKIITVDLTPPTAGGQQFRVTNVTYTGWLQ